MLKTELTNTALQSIRNFVRSEIAYAQYKVGNAWYQAQIQASETLADGRIAVSFLIDHTVAGNITVSRVRLYDRKGALWIDQAASITRADALEGILYRFKIMIDNVD